MTNQADFTTVVIVLVAFIAGYSVVSYVARKLKEGPFNPDLIGPHPKDSEPAGDDRDQPDDTSRKT